MNGLSYKTKKTEHKYKFKFTLINKPQLHTFVWMKRFNSKIGKGFIFFPSLILLGVTVLLIVEKVWLAVPINILLSIYLADVFIHTCYSIEENLLTILAGRFYKLQIPISNIYKIKPSRDPSKGPANSMDRLSIRYTMDGKKKEVLVSPENKEEFMLALKEINENIEFTGLYKQ
jgi:hypothetical protein